MYGVGGQCALWDVLRSVCSLFTILPVQVTQDRLDYKVPKGLRELLELARPARWALPEDRDRRGPQVTGLSSSVTALPSMVMAGRGPRGCAWGAPSCFLPILLCGDWSDCSLEGRVVGVFLFLPLSLVYVPEMCAQ